jgi:pilus assembly protein CpaE
MSVADNINEEGQVTSAAKVRLPVSLKIVVVSTADKVGDSIREMVDTVSGAKLEIIKSEISRIDDATIQGSNPDVLILDSRLDSPTDLERLRGLLQDAAANCCVIVTAETSNVEGVRRLMRLGITDFLPQPISRDDLLSALQLAARKVRQTRPTGGGKVVTFLHAGGGAGATTLAVNFACKVREENDDARVAILDLDIQFGQVAINMDLKNSHGVLDLLENPDRLDAMFVENVMTHHKSGVDVLVAPDVLVALDAIEPELVARIIGVLTELYDYVVIDMPLALTPWSQSVLGQSDIAVMVGQLTIPGIQQLRRLAGILTADGLGDVSTVFVVNRYLGGWKTSIRPKEAEKVLGRKIDYLVANDFKTASACIDQGVPLAEIKKRSAIAKNVSDMTKGILTLLTEKQGAAFQEV